jgi:hypothetical protein
VAVRTFELKEGRSIFGELRIDGPKSLLCLYDAHSFNARGLEDASVQGVLRDLTKVSLLDCVSLQSSERRRPKEKRYLAHLFPNYVVCGETHLRSTETVITSAEFLIEDAATLFYDFDAFGTVLDAKAHIQDLVRQIASKEKSLSGPIRSFNISRGSTGLLPRRPTSDRSQRFIGCVMGWVVPTVSRSRMRFG